MKKKILILVYIFVILLFLKQTLNIFYNRYVLGFYNNHNYSININLLESLNIFESYIAPYNNGNILYKNMQFKDAYKKYEQALNCWDLPEDKDCEIRVNMALCKVKMLDENFKNEEHIDESIELLNEARDILLENGCASDKGKGHHKDAQQLKEDIDKLLKELDMIKNPPPQPTPDPNDPTPSPDPNATPTPQPVPSGIPSPTPTESEGPGTSPTPQPTATPTNRPTITPEPTGPDGTDGEDGIRKEIEKIDGDAFKDRIKQLEEYINKAGNINWNSEGIW